MEAVPLQVGRTVLYMEPNSTVTIDVPPPVAVDEDWDGMVESGSLVERTQDGYTQLKAVLSEITGDISRTLVTEIKEHGPAAPKSLELTLSLSFSATSNVWVVSATGEGAISATLAWDFTA